MTAEAIDQATAELRARLALAIGGEVYVGPPIVDDVSDRKLSLFLFHVMVNQALRNERYLVADPGDAAGPLVEARALPLDLRFLITVFRSTGPGPAADPDELVTLGLAVQALHANPTLDSAPDPARITPEPYPMEELSRIWGLFPRASYRTSVVYLVSPVYVAVEPQPAAAPVRRRTLRPGTLTEPNAGGES
jgi:Pvc16 N-terminal domain